MSPLKANEARHGVGDEFPPGANEWPADLSRRQFLEVMGASLAIASLGACNRPPQKTIVPYVVSPDRDLLDGMVYYATAMPWEGFGRGLLALSHSGRPTKLEGNPAHPDSLGATDILMQAAVLSLYDPDRSQAPRKRVARSSSDAETMGTSGLAGDAPAQPTEMTTWDEFEGEWLTIHAQLGRARGKGLALLTEPTTSPTMRRGIHVLLEKFPDAHWYQHTALPRYDDAGEQDDYDFQRADVVLAIDADFLSSHPSSLRFAKAFAKRRRIERGKVDPNRLYAIEPALSVTGSMADHHLPASPRRTRQLLRAIEHVLGGGSPPSDNLDSDEQRFVRAVAADLRAKAPNVLCVAGEYTDPDFRAWASRINARLGADGVTRRALPAVRSDGDSRCAGDLAALVGAMAAGEVDTLVMVGTNPAYTAPADVPFVATLPRVRRKLHLGSHLDETAWQCDWHLPESHFLESWGDLRGYDGTASIVQPLISPLYASRSAVEFVFFLADPIGRPDYDLVRETWTRHAADGAEFEADWFEWLNRGVIGGTANAPTRPKPAATAELAAAAGDETLTLVIRPDPHVRDGAWANHAWLQELPKPNTQLVWDNAAFVAPTLASKRGLARDHVVTLRTHEGNIAAPVWIAPGVAPDCVVVHLGYGRTHAGKVGSNRGFDAYRLRTSRGLWVASLTEISPSDRRYVLVSTQEHFAMDGRDLVRTAAAAEPMRTAGRKPSDLPSLYPDWKYDGYRWGMLIDLGTCIGCKACVVACQAENNTPVVGKDQVGRGREMHWLRVDQYYDGDPRNPDVLHQPVPCMQCENAPCELVCPVAATVHSSEGLNDMVYNRCIGTRYCSNNCPYKVRRFNFFDYCEPENSPVYLQKNPEVTIRARGVMEKCTYCVQRIDAARITAERENRRVRDGEVRTACQLACPTEAIVFGDLNDPASRVVARKAEPTEYALLEELNTRPRTTYLARITNRNDAMDPAHG